jgi:DNA-binding ferritin-like protein (Dps family)
MIKRVFIIIIVVVILYTTIISPFIIKSSAKMPIDPYLLEKAIRNVVTGIMVGMGLEMIAEETVEEILNSPVKPFWWLEVVGQDVANKIENILKQDENKDWLENYVDEFQKTHGLIGQNNGTLTFSQSLYEEFQNKLFNLGFGVALVQGDDGIIGVDWNDERQINTIIGNPTVTQTNDGWKIDIKSGDGSFVIIDGLGRIHQYETIRGDVIGNLALHHLVSSNRPVAYEMYLVPYFVHNGEIYIFSRYGVSNSRFVSHQNLGISMDAEIYLSNQRERMFMFFRVFDGHINGIPEGRFLSGYFRLVREGNRLIYRHSNTYTVINPIHRVEFTLPNSVISMNDGDRVLNLSAVTNTPDIRFILAGRSHGLDIKRTIQSASSVASSDEDTTSFPIPGTVPGLNELINGGIEEGLFSDNPVLAFDNTGIVEIGGIDVQELQRILNINITQPQNPTVDLSGIISLLETIIRILPGLKAPDVIVNVPPAVINPPDVVVNVPDVVVNVPDVIVNVPDVVVNVPDVIVNVPEIPPMPPLPSDFGFILDRFPFSLPWDFWSLLTMFVVEPKEPIFIYDFNIQNNLLGIDIKREMTIDLTRFRFMGVDVFQEFIRFGIISLYVFGLIKATVKLALPK